MPIKRHMELFSFSSNPNSGLTEPASTVACCEPDRRAHRRYPIAADLHYCISRQHTVLEQGTGHTLNISTTGISFECCTPMPLGRKIEVTIPWPSRTADPQRVEFFAEGRVVRREGTLVAICFEQHGFRAIHVRQAIA
jgi:hypothetical protein